MTGKFSIKRRKQDTPRPSGQSSQRSLHALGIGVGRSSPHVASKPGHTHITDVTPLQRFERAQAWHASTGRPLPPQMRRRQPLQPPAAMGVRARWASYAGCDPADSDHLTVARLLDTGASQRGTGPRRRRLLHKAGAHGERPSGFTPAAAVTPGPRAPQTPAQRRRARKNAAQRARHDDRLDVYADEVTRFEEGA